MHLRSFSRSLVQGTAAFLLTAAVGSVAAQQPKDLLAMAKAQGFIRIANTQSSPPWTYVGEDNLPAGYDVEVAREVAKRIGIARIEFVADAGKNFVEGLKAGKYELVMNDMTPTPEREKQVDFSAPYGVEDFRVFVRIPTQLRSVADLQGEACRRHDGLEQRELGPCKPPRSEIVTLRQRRVGVQRPGDRPHRRDHQFVLRWHQVRQGQEPPDQGRRTDPHHQLSAAAMPKQQPALRAAVSAAVEAMISDGTIDRLSERWVGVSYRMSRRSGGRSPSS